MAGPCRYCLHRPACAVGLNESAFAIVKWIAYFASMIAISVSNDTRRLAIALAEMLNATLVEADLETRILAGEFEMLLDLSPVELLMNRDRLTAAALKGIPQLVSTGGLNGTPELLDAIGREIAEKASAARGPTLVLLPPANSPGQLALHQSIRNWIYPPKLLEECEGGFDSPEFAKRVVRWVQSVIS